MKFKSSSMHQNVPKLTATRMHIELHNY